MHQICNAPVMHAQQYPLNCNMTKYALHSNAPPTPTHPKYQIYKTQHMQPNICTSVCICSVCIAHICTWLPSNIHCSHKIFSNIHRGSHKILSAVERLHFDCTEHTPNLKLEIWEHLAITKDRIGIQFFFEILEIHHHKVVQILKSKEKANL